MTMTMAAACEGNARSSQESDECEFFHDASYPKKN
jgi:hypothetical protein